jgi:uncharacterized protein
VIWQFISAAVFAAVVAAVYIREIFLLSAFLRNRLQCKRCPTSPRSRSAVINHFSALIGIACILYGYFVEPRWIEVKFINIPTAKLARTNLRIIQISDLHCETKIVNEDKMVEIVNSLKPDLIVFTGDSLNMPGALPVFRDTMRRLRAAIGKYAVTGNDDLVAGRGLDLFYGTGFYLLKEEGIRLEKDGEPFFISGSRFEYSNQWRKALAGAPAGPYSIFLYHTPDLIEELKGANMDLYLAGHTHGGQVALPFYGALLTLSKYGKEYESGEYSVNGITLYVNRGIGSEGKILRASGDHRF